MSAWSPVFSALLAWHRSNRDAYTNYLRVMAGLVRREGGRDPAASGYPDVVLAATLGAQLRADMYTRILTARADTADSQRVTKAPTHVTGPTSIDPSGDPSDPGAACRRKTTSLVAFVDAALRGHQMPTVQIRAENRLDRLRRCRAGIIPNASHRRRNPSTYCSAHLNQSC